MFVNNIIFNIYKFLDVYNLNKCCRINRQFYEIYKNDILWKYFSLSVCGADDIEYNLIESNTFYYKYKMYHSLSKLKNKLNLNQSINSLVNLKTLSLSHNKISVIPEQISCLVNLQTLFLSRNQISVIHESIDRNIIRYI